MSIKNLGYLAWKNDLAWMEYQKDPKLAEAIEKENRNFNASLKGLHLKTYRTPLTKNQWAIGEWTVEKGMTPVETWSHGSFKQIAWDADLSDDFFAAAVPDTDGYERFSVEVFSLKPISHLKTLSKTGPQVAFYKGMVIYLESSKDLRYDSVKTWDPETDLESTIYTLENPIENLELKRAEDGSVYVLATDFVNVRLGFVSTNGIRWEAEAKDVFVVNSKKWILNQKSFSDEPLESMSLKGEWFVTRSHGIRNLWSTKGKDRKIMITVWGEIRFDTRDPTILHITDLRYEPYTVNTETWTLSNPQPYDFPITQYRYPVPTFVVYPKGDIRGLLVTAYGAYGRPTKTGTLVERWQPLLLRGWAIASVCVPGSGDHDTEWKESGQRRNRRVAIDSLRDAIVNLQEELSIPAKATCLYGRSAGGLLVISTATLYPELQGALYVESPYVDVLRTISNEDLPLTTLETREFGIGTNALNILATQSWSPMEHIPADGMPGLFVVARSDLADLEVFPYEVLKWIWRIRATGGQKKLLSIGSGKGHFATDVETRAEDFALLDGWLENNLRYKYKMVLSRKNKMNKSRKNKMNKSRKNKTGGKRRVAKKSTRRGRKGTRRH